MEDLNHYIRLLARLIIKMSEALRSPGIKKVVNLLLSTIAAMAVGSIIMILYGKNPIEVYKILWDNSVGTQTAFFISIQRATPLIFTGMAALLSFRTGTFNVGGDGQFFIGAICGTFVGYAVDLPAILHLPLTLLAGFLGGVVWAAIPTIMRQRFGISEIITGIMTNYIASALVTYLVNYPMRASPTMPATPEVLPTAKLPTFSSLPGGFGQGSQAHVGVFLGLAIVVIMYIAFKRLNVGYEWRMVGISFPFARLGGINARRSIALSMLLSGGIAGLGGLVEILGVQGRFLFRFTADQGLRGLLAALLGQQTVIGTMLASLFYGATQAGGMGLDWALGIPPQLVDIIVTLIVFFIAAEGLWDLIWKKRLVNGKRSQESQESLASDIKIG